MESWILVDAVDLGLPESERDHPGAGSFGNRYGVVTSDYGGPANRVDRPGGGPSHWRDFANWASVGFMLDAASAGGPLVVSLLVRAYRIGTPPAPPAPTRVYVESGGARRPIGEFRLEPDGGWRLLDFAVPDGAPAADLRVVLDDGENVHSPEHHYGKSVAFIRIYRRDG